MAEKESVSTEHASGQNAPNRNGASTTDWQRVGTPDLDEPVPPVMPWFPIVAVGASAGGLEAFTGLLQHLPVDTGMAFVLIQHLAPQHASMLVSLLSRTTAMPVAEAGHGIPVQPDHVYIIPPNTLMSIGHGILILEPRPEERGAPRPIDHFFRFLAADRQSAAIGVVLSGADSDGAQGLQAIREEGGIAIVQSESSAKHPDMPRAALAAGAVDLVLPPEEIARELERIARYPSLTTNTSTSVAANTPSDELQINRIFALLNAAAKVDFRGYKRGTIERRISRRMILQRHESLEVYASRLESDRSELLNLCEDLLIKVTGFFRDPEVFQALEGELLPRLLGERPTDSPLRVWVQGCSTGEEVYSIAMSLLEVSSNHRNPAAIQIFGTDISERSLATARAAVYPENLVTRLSSERQARFFTRVERGYQVVKSVREMCVFARHNLLSDPPFSRINLISCRNVLIYLGSASQRLVISTCHYALRPGGYLILGKSESLRGFPEFFSPADRQHRFFVRNAAQAHASMELISRGFAGEQPGGFASASSVSRAWPIENKLEKAAEQIVLSEFGPAWVIVNNNLEILHVRGDTSPYLQLASGRATLTVLKMAKEGIRGELRKLLAQAHGENGPVMSSVLRLKQDGEIRSIRLEVRRIVGPPGRRDGFLILFLAHANDSVTASQALSAGALPGSEAKAASAEVERLKQELNLTSQHMQSIIDERNAVNQDLISANEEIQSSNEELQSINEELETSKEELQSSIEELNTVNEELQNRNRDLSRTSDDLMNLLSSTTIPILMLDQDLRIRLMTSATERLFSVRPTDIGRSMGDIRTRLSFDGLEPLVRRVMETLSAEEQELQDRDGRWHLLRVRPYRTSDNRILGAVLALIDIDQLRRAQSGIEAERRFAESVVESVPTPLLVLRRDSTIRIANRAFYQAYRLQPAQVENQLLHEMGGKQWDLPALRTAMEQLATDQEPIQALEIEQEVAGLGRRVLLINALQVHADGENQILVAVEDITAQKQIERILIAEQERLKRNVEVGETALRESEEALLQNRNELRALAASLLNSQGEERRRVSRELHDDLSQQLAKLQFDVETLEHQLPPDLKRAKTRLKIMRNDVGRLSNDLRRIAYELHPSTLDHLGLSVALRSLSREFSEREGLPIKFTGRKLPARIPIEVASALYRIAQEALRNIAKHAGKTSARIVLAGGSSHLSLSVLDNGVGFDPLSMKAKGGLGLISMQERARLINGEFSLESSPGHGVTITVRVSINWKGA
jgi:two-component system, chemotaxis family, CheB/CheR fusion protein